MPAQETFADQVQESPQEDENQRLNQEKETVSNNSLGSDFLAETTVGMAGSLDAIVIPGELLTVKSSEDRHQPFVLRIVNTYKHGTDHRYDLEFYALEPGTYNVSDYVVRADGSGPIDLPAMWVNVNSSLAQGQVTPNELPQVQLPRLGGYRLMWILGGLLWLAGLAAFFLTGRRRHKRNGSHQQAPESMAQRLRPLVQAALDGRLDARGLAALERSLIAYWCKRLNLEGKEPGEVMLRLRNDEKAGPLMTSLEDWLHRPKPPQNVDIETLLEPYRNVSDAEFPCAEDSPDLDKPAVSPAAAAGGAI